MCNDDIYRFTIYSDGVFNQNGETQGGYHTWVKIEGTYGGGSYSFGPTGSIFGSPGTFRIEPADREALVPQYTGYIPFETYANMYAMAKFLDKNPPYYQIFQSGGDNCVEVTSKILEAGGINVLKGILTPSGAINVINILNTTPNGEYLFYPEYDPENEECEDEEDKIDDEINNDFNTAANVLPRRWDPLIFGSVVF